MHPEPLLIDRAVHDLADAGAAVGPRRAILTTLVAGAVAGACVGAFGVQSGGGLLSVVYAAIKVPAMLLISAAIALPGFFVICTVRGLRDGWPVLIASLLRTQAVIAVVLAAIGPVTVFVYFSGVSYRAALLWNGGAFLLASLLGQRAMRRLCARLVHDDPRHRGVLRLWTVMYAFVGIQMAWTLRPFLGAPGAAATFFRDEPFTNAYVVVLRLIFG